MNRTACICDTLRLVVQMIVAVPGCVGIRTESARDRAGREVTLFEIHVHQSDREKLVGEGWANLRALRRLLNSAGHVSGASYRAKVQ